MSVHVETHDRGNPEGARHRLVLAVFLIIVATAGALFFIYKIYEFFQDMVDEAGIHFAGPHLVTYFFVALGFFLILAYAFLKGHFSEIEKPKYDMLEREERYDREDYAGE